MGEDIGELLDTIGKIRKAKPKGIFAPHKPLLILYAIGKLVEGESKLLFSEIHHDVAGLLRDFGPIRERYRPEYPFWHLGNGSIWEVSTSEPILMKRKGDSVSKRELLSKNACGSFTSKTRRILLSHPENVSIVCNSLLQSNFPETLHQDIIDAVGLDIRLCHSPRKRSADFRRRVLRAYESRCCICGFDMRLGDKLAGVDAAHIKWWHADGPDVESNGLALCTLHHKLFDLGAFTITDKDHKIICSQDLSGSTKLEWLLSFHGVSMREPQSSSYFPRSKYLTWHRNTIFRGPPRIVE